MGTGSWCCKNGAMTLLSLAAGDNEYKVSPGGPLEQKVIAKPDITHVQCTAADWVIVACDGMWPTSALSRLSLAGGRNGQSMNDDR